MPEKNALLLLGGSWHEMDGFARAAAEILAHDNWIITATRDQGRLSSLRDTDTDMVMLYTCFTPAGEKVPGDGIEGLDSRALADLRDWVAGGGRLLALHAATVQGTSGPGLGELIGGVFVKHPPLCEFQVLPVYGGHPITAGISGFTITDELYHEQWNPDSQILMVSLQDNIAYPCVWTRMHGSGRVAHIALGHDQRAWDHPCFQTLLRQAANWL